VHALDGVRILDLSGGIAWPPGVLQLADGDDYAFGV
jgi:hypothetical protein